MVFKVRLCHFNALKERAKMSNAHKNISVGIGCLCLALLWLLASVPGVGAQPFPKPWEEWRTDFNMIDIPETEIMSGGPPKDGIPSIDHPKFVSIAEATQYSDREPVIGFEFKGMARAYPLSVLTWHEIVNDVFDGHAVAVTYCPLCNAAIVFDAMIEGKPHAFGTTGRLRRSDLLMYDRVTESWWQQFSGEAIIGEYLGKNLKIQPSRLESFANFKSRFPDGKVLVPNNPGFRRYGSNPYIGYDSSQRPFLFRGEFPEGISPMARVIVVRTPDKPIILSMDKIRKAGAIKKNGLTFGWTAGQASALDSGFIGDGKDVGNITVVNTSDGKDVAYDVTFAFVAHAFHPDVKIEQ